MWCRACGAPLTRPSSACRACGRPLEGPEAAGRPAHPAAGAPCEAGRSLGGLRIDEIGTGLPVEGLTPAGLLARGVKTLFRVRAEGLGAVELAYVCWEGGEREIGRVDEAGSRVEVEDWGDGHLTMDLGHASQDGGAGIAQRPASEYELDAAAHACVRCALQAAGATAMGTRQEVLGLGDERRHHLCTTFPRESRRVPAVVYALTRLAPLLHTSGRRDGHERSDLGRRGTMTLG